jgi:hypothetical protein
MKTQVIIATALLTIASLTATASPQRFLTVYDTSGRALVMIFQFEEKTECLPFNLREEFNKAVRSDANRIIDISGMVTPEEEVNDAPFNLQRIFREVTAK